MKPCSTILGLVLTNKVGIKGNQTSKSFKKNDYTIDEERCYSSGKMTKEPKRPEKNWFEITRYIIFRLNGDLRIHERKEMHCATQLVTYNRK